MKALIDARKEIHSTWSSQVSLLQRRVVFHRGVYLCASTLKEDFDERAFLEAIVDVSFDGLAYKGYVVDDGLATVCSSKETCWKLTFGLEIY